MKQLDKRNLLKYAQNEYLGAVLAAKLARRLHSMPAEDRPDPHEKVTSLALRLINEGKVEYEVTEHKDEKDEGEEK
jgi:DNA-directed RNA polymerase subunit K/omega